jgi:2-dehydro-3-deoxyphosphooctonate aldolase (KDO 8-P synthase)
MIYIAGPCVVEERELMFRTAEALCERHKGNYFYFKSSIRKANRTSSKSYTGPGFDEGLEILYRIKERFGCKLLTDIHEPWEAGPVADVVDVIQIPALLSRQSDLIKAGRDELDQHPELIMNVKKGQFMAPWDVEGILSKTGTERVWITERGTCFGYNRLVVDFAGVAWMLAHLPVPIIFDCTHSLQLPSSFGAISGGQPEYAVQMAKAAIAVGVDGVFTEVHPNPESALSDGNTMLDLETYLKKLF